MFVIGAEVFHQTVYQTDFPKVGTAFNIGMVIDFNEHQHLLFSAGRSIDGPIGFPCYVAYQFDLWTGSAFTHSAIGRATINQPWTKRLFGLLKTAARQQRCCPAYYRIGFLRERMKKFMFPASGE